MIPKYKQVRPRGVHVAGDHTNPESDWFSSHTNTTVAAKPKKPKNAPVPTMQYAVTPMAKSGTLYGPQG